MKRLIQGTMRPLVLCMADSIFVPIQLTYQRTSILARELSTLGWSTLLHAQLLLLLFGLKGVCELFSVTLCQKPKVKNTLTKTYDNGPVLFKDTILAL